MKKTLTFLLTGFLLFAIFFVFTACNTHTHIFDKQVISDEYKNSEATCVKKAQYFYSCECGEKGTEIFENGDLGEHTYSNEWVVLDTHHYKNATCGCDVRGEYGEHVTDENSGFCICGLAMQPTEGVFYSVSADNTYAEVIDYNGTSTKVNIAPTYKGLPVKKIGNNAFANCWTLETIIIPNSVTIIGQGAFKDCSCLLSVEIPDSVTSIGIEAFMACERLQTITFAKGSKLENIGAQVFMHCQSLQKIVIPASVIEMGVNVFYSCTNLTDIYCEVESLPNDWDINWKTGCNAAVHWGYKGN